MFLQAGESREKQNKPAPLPGKGKQIPSDDEEGDDQSETSDDEDDEDGHRGALEGYVLLVK